MHRDDDVSLQPWHPFAAGNATTVVKNYLLSCVLLFIFQRVLTFSSGLSGLLMWLAGQTAGQGVSVVIPCNVPNIQYAVLVYSSVVPVYPLAPVAPYTFSVSLTLMWEGGQLMWSKPRLSSMPGLSPFTCVIVYSVAYREEEGKTNRIKRLDIWPWKEGSKRFSMN